MNQDNSNTNQQPPTVPPTDPVVADTFNQPQDSPISPQVPSTRERQPLPVAQSAEFPAGVQSVEELRSVEISPEVEKYITEVSGESQGVPQEIVIRQQEVQVPDQVSDNAPAIVLPITQEAYKEYKKAPLNTSRRWLAEFTHKISQIFKGNVVFLQAEREPQQ